MTLLKTLIDIPERVSKGDFVLKLTEGVANADATLRDYVVTPELVKQFDDAFSFIREAVEQRTSKASYLHGSFGSGKSHFMAVLHLILQGNASARAIPALAPVVAKHDQWMRGRRFLLVPFHMIGAESLESHLFAGYVEHVGRMHPDAPLPGVYLAEGLFRDALGLRGRLGDPKFFQALNEGTGGAGWGSLDTEWDAARFDRALSVLPGDPDRDQLVGRLVATLFPAYREIATRSTQGFVSFDDGLAILSRHASDLGYDALIFFLDELILWLATRASEPEFVNREGSKLSKLVEAQAANRPVPIVSFVARQRDLRELVGHRGDGAQELNFADILQYWEARFHTITLEDRNLPEIASKRVLRPKGEAERQQIQRAFETTRTIRDEYLKVLLTSDANEEQFRKTYPFSPALVQALIAASSALQRERTALKVMVQLLVDNRETLELEQLIPVGDLFDVLAEGDAPFTEKMRRDFDNAKRLYQLKLAPLLERSHGLTLEQVRQGQGDAAKLRAFRTDDRLIKTLLLAALIPEVPCFAGLNPTRLAALNHGTIRTPIAGREAQEVLRRCRDWAAQVGELKISGDDVNPTIALQLSGIDTQGILDNAMAEDNVGNRRRTLKTLLYSKLGIEQQDKFFQEHSIVWKGSRRSFEVVFGNVREQSDDQFRTPNGEIKVIIDFPFDPDGRPSSEDLGRLEDFRGLGKPASTLCWLPLYLSRQALDDLGTLVKLEHALTEEGFRRCAGHLSAREQQQARPLLENQQTQLQVRIVQALEGAYGIAQPPAGLVEESHEPAEIVQWLGSSFTPQPPVGANLKTAFENLLSQVLGGLHPAHPDFGDQEIRSNAIRKVLDEVVRATESPDGRIIVEQSLRVSMRQIAVPLRLGQMGDGPFVIGRHWLDHFHQRHAAVGGGLTVGKLRQWMDEPRSMGLVTDMQDLLVLTFAAQSQRTLLRYGTAIQASMGGLRDEDELREQALPDAAEWEAAVERAGKVFGIALSPLRSAANLADAVRQLRQKLTKEGRQACADTCREVEARLQARSLPAATANRLRTARAVMEMVEALSAAPDDRLLGVLNTSRIETSLDAMGSSWRKSAEVVQAIRGCQWQVFDAIGGRAEIPAAAVEGLRKDVDEVLAADEYVIELAPKLHGLVQDAINLLSARPPSTPQPGPTPVPQLPPPAPRPGTRVVSSGDRIGVRANEAAALLEEIRRDATAARSRRLDVRWIVQDEDVD